MPMWQDARHSFCVYGPIGSLVAQLLVAPPSQRPTTKEHTSMPRRKPVLADVSS